MWNSTMWIQIDRDIFAARRSEYIEERIAHYADTDSAALYREAARRECGELEVDDDAVVSESEDGAYVMSWQWVPKTRIAEDDDEE